MKTRQTPENSNDQEHFNLEYWLAILKRRRKVFMAVAGVIFLISIIGVFRAAPTYRSEFAIYFPTPQTQILPASSNIVEQMGISPELIGQFLGQKVPDLQDYAIAILDSRTLKDKILDKYGDRIFPDLPPDYPRVKERDLLTNRVINIQILPKKMVPVKVETNDPRLSYEVAKFYLEEYKKFEEKAMLTAAKRKRVHLEKQKKVISKKLNDAMYAMSRFEQSKKVVDLDSETQQAIKALSELKFYESIIESEKKRALETLSALKEKMKTSIEASQDQASSAILSKDPVISSLFSQVTQLQVQLVEEKKTKTDNHPDIISLKSSIDTLKEKIRERLKEISSTVNTNTQVDLVMAEVEYKSLDAQHQALKEEIRKSRKVLERYPEIRVTYNKLQRKIDSYQAILSMVEEEYEKARIEEEREGGQAQILDYPNLPDASSGPSVLYRMMVALGYSFIFGLMAVFYVEYTHRTIDNIKEKADQIDSEKTEHPDEEK